MKWNPLLSALSATLYIFAVALVIHYLESIRHDTKDTMFDTMSALSLLVLSVAVMGFLFAYHPITLLLQQRPKEAGWYLLKTIALFSLITVSLLTIASIQ